MECLRLVGKLFKTNCSFSWEESSKLKASSNLATGMCQTVGDLSHTITGQFPHTTNHGKDILPSGISSDGQSLLWNSIAA